MGDEQPARLKQMVFRALSEGIITSEKAKDLCPGCRELTEPPELPEPRPFGSPSDLLRLPRAMRRAILAKAAEMAEKDYWKNRGLTDLEAFGEEDLQNEQRADRSPAGRSLTRAPTVGAEIRKTRSVQS